MATVNGLLGGSLKSNFERDVDEAVSTGDLKAMGDLMKRLYVRLQNEEIAGREGRGLLLKLEKDVVVLQERVGCSSQT
jgi:hypothetical protein